MARAVRAPPCSSTELTVEPQPIHLLKPHLIENSLKSNWRGDLYTVRISRSNHRWLTTLVCLNAPLSDSVIIYLADIAVDNMSRATSSPRPPSDDDGFNDGISAKRRKVRKGTRSCWECRQRKMKCTFNQPTDNMCIRCHRRGIKCVSQEYPKEITSSLEQNLHMGDRMARVEKLLDKLLDQEPPAAYRTGYRAKSPAGEQNDHLGSSAPGSKDSLATALLKPLTVCAHRTAIFSGHIRGHIPGKVGR